MKVFRVITEQYNDDGTITETSQFVTQSSNCILAVTEYMADKCRSLGDELKSVSEVLVVSDQIP